MADLATIQMQANSGGVRTSATALPDHNREIGFIQNIGTNPLFVKLGNGCSTTDYDFILKGCTVEGDGQGGCVDFQEEGIITIAGTSPKYTAFER